MQVHVEVAVREQILTTLRPAECQTRLADSRHADDHPQSRPAARGNRVERGQFIVPVDEAPLVPRQLPWNRKGLAGTVKMHAPMYVPRLDHVSGRTGHF